MMLFSYRGIRESFGFTDVLKGVDLDITEGQKIGLVGRNGAGKTTLANIIFGLLQPDAGSIVRHRKDITIGYLFQSVSYSMNTFSDMLEVHNNAGQMGELLETAGSLGLYKTGEMDAGRLNGLSGG